MRDREQKGRSVVRVPCIRICALLEQDLEGLWMGVGRSTGVQKGLMNG